MWNDLILHKRFYPIPNDNVHVEDLGYCYDDNSAIGILFLKTPDDIGSSAYKVYSGAIMPNKDNERYLVMAGYYYQSGIYQPYDSLGFAEFAFMSSGRFSLYPGETKELVIALIGSPYINNDTSSLALRAFNAKKFYFDSLMTKVKETDKLKLPTEKLILQVYPNPFCGEIHIRMQIPDNIQRISLKIYDIAGKLVKQFNQITNCQSSNQVVWNGTDDDGKTVANGIYFVVLENGSKRLTEKLIVMR